MKETIPAGEFENTKSNHAIDPETMIRNLIRKTIQLKPRELKFQENAGQESDR